MVMVIRERMGCVCGWGGGWGYWFFFCEKCMRGVIWVGGEGEGEGEGEGCLLS